VIRTSSGVSVAAALGVFLLPFGRPGTRGLCPFGRLGSRFGLASCLFRVAADDLLDTHWKRPPFLDAHQGESEEGKPWYRLAIQAGEEPIEAMGVLAGFCHDDFIARDEVDIRWAV